MADHLTAVLEVAFIYYVKQNISFNSFKKYFFLEKTKSLQTLRIKPQKLYGKISISKTLSNLFISTSRQKKEPAIFSFLASVF